MIDNQFSQPSNFLIKIHRSKAKQFRIPCAITHINAYFLTTNSQSDLVKVKFCFRSSRPLEISAFKVPSPCAAEVSEPRRSGYVAGSRFGTAFRFQSVRVTLKVLASDSRAAATIEKHIAIFLAEQTNPTPFSPHK